MSLAYLPREAPNSSLIEVCDDVPHGLPKMRDLIFLMRHSQSFSRWDRERVASSFACNGGRYLSYDYVQLIATQVTQDARPKIVDALLMLISRMGQGSCLSIF